MRFSFKKIFCAILTAAIVFSFVGCGGVSASPDIKPHLTLNTEKHAVPIDGFDAFTMPEIDGDFRERVEVLYQTVVYDKKRPLFVDDDPVKQIYDVAKGWLEDYITDGMTGEEREYAVVHTIHDLLIVKTDYDFDLYNSSLGGSVDAATDPAFYIDGVFLNGKTVCDGLARAFNFLCAMEGVECVRVTGSFSSATHAWNKVKIGDSYYNVDVTADAVHYSIGSKTYKQVAHGYMLLSDETIAGFAQKHDFTPTHLIAQSDFDYYDGGVIEIGGKTYSTVVKNQSQLNALFSAISDAKGEVGKIELKLDFDGKTQVNFADMYSSEIATAYDKVKNSDFALGNGIKPYFQFPNGVYLFLIYK